MVNGSGERVNGVFYSRGALKALGFLVQADKVRLGDIASSCGVHKSTVHGYVSALIAKGLATSSGNSSNLAIYYWCTDKEKAQVVLEGARTAANKDKEASRGKVEIDGVEFSINELRVLRCILEAPEPITPARMVPSTGLSLTYVHKLLQTLFPRQLLDRTRRANDAYRYWCKDSGKVKAILNKVNPILLERR